MNKQTTEELKAILAGAPEGATHKAIFTNQKLLEYVSFRGGRMFVWCTERWMSVNSSLYSQLKSLSGIAEIIALRESNAELEGKITELNKECGEFQKGFFEYMGLCDHLQIEVDNLKKKITVLTTPDTSKKSGCGL